MKKRKSKSKKLTKVSKIEQILQKGLEHIARNWGWYLLWLSGIYVLSTGLILRALFFLIECISAAYHWFIADNYIAKKPISSLTLSDIGDVIFRMWIVYMIFIVVKSIYQAYTDKDEREDSNI